MLSVVWQKKDIAIYEMYSHILQAHLKEKRQLVRLNVPKTDTRLQLTKLFKRIIIAIIIIALLWLVLFLYLILSPSSRLSSCVDNSGLWDSKEKKCYCDFERGEERNICMKNLVDDLQKKHNTE